MEGPTRMLGQPGTDFGLLLGRIIVQDDVDGLIGGHFGFDGVQEADELLMPVPLHVAADHGAIQDIESSEQSGWSRCACNRVSWLPRDYA